MTKEAATCLFTGIITDSGRFLYSLSKELFNCASVLIDNGAEANKIYKFLYSESLFKKKMRAYFVNKIKVNKYGLGYIINNQDVKPTQFSILTYSGYLENKSSIVKFA
jgi:phosphoesterase RecJ-like protein